MTATLDNATARTLSECYHCPTAFAERFLGISPTGQQRKFLGEIARPGARAAVRSGHGTGKSTALSIAALWFLSTRRDALVPCTAPTAHQLQDVLWREMRRLIARMSEKMQAQYAVSQDRVTLRGSAGMIVGRTARPEKPDALQGFHAEEILFIIDEAAGVNDAIFQVAQGALSTPSARVAMAANPTRLSGYFFEAFHKNREGWARLQFSCLESTLVAKNYAEDVQREYGEDSDMYRVRVLGEFPKSGLFNLISMEHVEAAMTKTAPLTFESHAPKIIGVDPAWLGGDRSAAVLRQGMLARTLFTVRGVDTLKLAELVARKAAELDADAIFVDQTGVGAGVVDQLRRTAYSVTGIAFSNSPLEANRFVNRRAEMWWRMREWLEQGPVIVRDNDLRDDLVAPEYFMTDGGKVQLESKESMRKRGIASPDLGDALALTFAMPVYPRDRRRIPGMSRDDDDRYDPFGG